MSVKVYNSYEHTCPQCGAEAELVKKCTRCKWKSPALMGKNNESVKEVKEMEQEESHQRRLMVMEEEIKIAEETLMKLEPMKEEYAIEIDYIRKQIMDVMYKFIRIKKIAERVEELKEGVPKDLWIDIMAESFPSSERVILEYTRKDWSIRLFAYIAGEFGMKDGERYM